jgi:hypothetical protein
MPWVVNGNIRIELLDINWQKFPADGSQGLVDVTNFTMVTDILSIVTDILPMVTDVYLMVAKESSVANPQKAAKIDEK